MKQTAEEIRNIMAASIEEGVLRPQDIPELNLYVDQILTLFEDKASQGSGDKKERGERVLTKSMVNNYVKEKLILPVQGKKYTRQQVLQLLYVFHLKNTLPIGEIKQVMFHLMEEGCTAQSMEQILQVVPQARAKAKQTALEIAQPEAGQGSAPLSVVEAAALLLEISELSAMLKQAAQRVAECCFAPEIPEKSLKPEKKKTAKENE